ncbi:MAG: glycosyltransferase family 2 protein [Oscillospiraceae bacterium]|nr:glycosyltransferase family 2 protein [Oscillospiraceae bacterium]MBR3536730.1 glycosyltransferase family 2 protein [Oscillospiraceae bacterium]
MSELAFVIPVFIREGDTAGLNQFKKTLNSIKQQTSEKWSVIIIDDNSQNDELSFLIEVFTKCVKQKVILHHNQETKRPGASRNIGIKIAKEALDSEYVMFIDADDINDLKRVEETKNIIQYSHPDVIYSHFIPIDSNDLEINISKLSYSIQHIMLALLSPPSGKNIWREMLLGKAYVNLTSSTTVKIDLAMKFPFSEDIHCEDVCTWLQYGMYGASYYYTPNIPSLYRIPDVKAGSISRGYIGNDRFNHDFVRSVIRGLNTGIPFLLKEGIAPEYIKLLMIKYMDLVECTLKQDGFINEIDKIEELMIRYKSESTLYLNESVFT